MFLRYFHSFFVIHFVFPIMRDRIVMRMVKRECVVCENLCLRFNVMWVCVRILHETIISCIRFSSCHGGLSTHHLASIWHDKARTTDSNHLDSCRKSLKSRYTRTYFELNSFVRSRNLTLTRRSLCTPKDESNWNRKIVWQFYTSWFEIFF